MTGEHDNQPFGGPPGGEAPLVAGERPGMAAGQPRGTLLDLVAWIGAHPAQMQVQMRGRFRRLDSLDDLQAFRVVVGMMREWLRDAGLLKTGKG